MSSPAGEPPTLVIEAGRAERHYWADLWRYRELLGVLAGTRALAFLGWIGLFSYSFYLIHVPFISPGMNLLARLGPPSGVDSRRPHRAFADPRLVILPLGRNPVRAMAPASRPPHP